jgi:hypothetical protein
MGKITRNRFGYGVIRPVGRKKRISRRYFRKENAVRAIEEWGQGSEVFGFTKGQFSMVDLLEALLDRTGEADIVISTWTAGSRDLQRCLSFLQRDLARSMLWLVDISFERRVPELALRLKEMFGESSVRVIPSHCKFILLKNSQWNVVVQTSMNLNYNLRMENFWIADDRELYAAYHELIEMVFSMQREGVGFGRQPKDARAEFKWLEDTSGLDDLDLEIEDEHIR